MGSFTFNLPGVTSATASLERVLNTNVKDEDLVYTGNDNIVWDRTNAERLRRGLPGLAQLGYPRPPDEPDANAPLPPSENGSARTFEIKGPPGLTYEQAKAIFDQQVKSGGLVGYKPGDVLSAATQAADGLPEAEAVLAQAQSKITGALGAGIPGAAGAVGQLNQAFAQAGGAVRGLVSGQVPGLSTINGPAVTDINRSLGVLTGAAAAVGAVATTAIGTINKVLTTTPVTNPIDVANFTKVPTALAPLASMDVPQVTAVMAQAKNLVGQGFDAVSNAKGVGSFGLDVKQLENAGVVKPGTSNFLTQVGATVTSVLKSPSVWTGKDGLTNLGSLLKNPTAQVKLQQDLMTKGVKDLASLGVPVDKLSAQGVAGMALNAAKNLPAAEAFVKGLPLPGDASGALKAAFDANVRDGAFAVNLAQTKLPEAFKEIEIPLPADNTVNRETLNAAVGRIVGNDKIPIPDYGAKLERSLSANVKDEDLVYTGNDTIVWDRVNRERLARGLPGLAAIGYPRPPEEPADSTTLTA